MGHYADNEVPNQVLDTDGVGFLSDITQITTGAHSTCALKNNGSVVCW